LKRRPRIQSVEICATGWTKISLPASSQTKLKVYSNNPFQVWQVVVWISCPGVVPILCYLHTNNTRSFYEAILQATSCRPRVVVHQVLPNGAPEIQRTNRAEPNQNEALRACPTEIVRRILQHSDPVPAVSFQRTAWSSNHFTVHNCSRHSASAGMLV